MSERGEAMEEAAIVRSVEPQVVGRGIASMLAYALLAWLWRPAGAAALRPVAA